MAKELLFLKDASNPFKKKPKQQGEEEAKYEEMVTRNFYDVGYTPTLKSIYDNLDSKYFDAEDEDDSSDDSEGDDSEEEGEEGVETEIKKKILKVEKTKGGKLEQDYERQLDSQQKSDMLIAYSNFKLLV